MLAAVQEALSPLQFPTWFFFFFFSALGLPCFMWAFSNGCSKQELVFVVVHGILTAVASVVVEHRF